MQFESPIRWNQSNYKIEGQHVNVNVNLLKFSLIPSASQLNAQTKNRYNSGICGCCSPVISQSNQIIRPKLIVWMAVYLRTLPVLSLGMTGIISLSKPIAEAREVVKCGFCRTTDGRNEIISSWILLRSILLCQVPPNSLPY